jgi:hypothetical protein
VAKTKLETKKWLMEDLGFSEAEATELLPKFDSRMDKVNEGYSRQSDYDRMMNEGKAELTKAQKDLSDANERLNAEIAEWARTQAEGGTITAKMQKDLDAAKLDAFKLQQTLTRVATEAGLDPAKVMEGVVAIEAPKSAAAAAPDLSGYLKTDDYRAEIGSVATAALRMPAMLAKIAREHKALTGQDIDETQIVAEIETRARTKGNQKSLDPIQVWEELHNVPTLREKAAEKKFNEAIAAAEQRGREAAFSEQVPGAHTPTLRHAPIFGGQERKSVLQRPQPGGTVNAAAAALRSGKYREASKAS